MYDPKFTQKEMYDQYGSSRKTTKTKPNPGKQFADTMKAGGGGRNTSGIGAKRPPSNTFGGGQDNNPNRDEYENKPTIDKLKEKAVNLFESLGADKPEALIIDGKRVYQGPLFRGYDPTARIGDFGGDAGKKQYRFGMPLLGEVSPSYPSPTLPSGSNNPTLNMFGVRRGFTGGPDMPELPTSTDVPANTDSVSRILSQAMLPTEVNYTIQDGDTLSEIARDADTTVEELKELNNIENIDEIDAGANLKVPVKSGKLTDTQAALRRGLNTDKNNEGVQTAMSRFPSSVLSDAQTQQTGADTYETADDMTELEILARTIQAEAGGESKQGKLAVGAVIKNRADQNRFGTDIRSVILKPYQFSPWNTYTDSAGGEQGKDMLGEKMKPSKDAYDAAKKILSGDYVDPTLGASHFVNPRISKPNWYKGFKDNGTTKIGKHEFGDADKVLFTGNVPPPMTSLKPKARPKGLGAK